MKNFTILVDKKNIEKTKQKDQQKSLFYRDEKCHGRKFHLWRDQLWSPIPLRLLERKNLWTSQGNQQDVRDQLCKGWRWKLCQKRNRNCVHWKRTNHHVIRLATKFLTKFFTIKEFANLAALLLIWLTKPAWTWSYQKSMDTRAAFSQAANSAVQSFKPKSAKDLNSISLLLCFFN